MTILYRPKRPSLLRTFAVLALAYCLVVQSLVGPLLALGTPGASALIAELCLVSAEHGLPGEDGPRDRHVHTSECCLPGQRGGLDVALPAIETPHEWGVVRDGEVAIAAQPPQSRAPPSITATPRRTRAPPLPA